MCELLEKLYDKACNDSHSNDSKKDKRNPATVVDAARRQRTFRKLFWYNYQQLHNNYIECRRHHTHSTSNSFLQLNIMQPHVGQIEELLLQMVEDKTLKTKAVC